MKLAYYEHTITANTIVIFDTSDVEGKPRHLTVTANALLDDWFGDCNICPENDAKVENLRFIVDDSDDGESSYIDTTYIDAHGERAALAFDSFAEWLANVTAYDKCLHCQHNKGGAYVLACEFNCNNVSLTDGNGTVFACDDFEYRPKLEYIDGRKLLTVNDDIDPRNIAALLRSLPDAVKAESIEEIYDVFGKPVEKCSNDDLRECAKLFYSPEYGVGIAAIVAYCMAVITGISFCANSTDGNIAFCCSMPWELTQEEKTLTPEKLNSIYQLFDELIH